MQTNNFNLLEDEIQELIDSHTEGDYWDFKQEWYSHNSDLLHDIICMANSLANRDCYIIIGVNDDYKIIGVGDKNRKNQQNVIDFLRQKPKWAGGYIPQVYVKTICISHKELDIIIIKQSNNTPFYLLEDYKKGDGNPLFKGVIYIRKGDSNTPKTGTSDLYDVEILWKRRFGLLYNPSQRAKFYLKDIENWERINYEMDKEIEQSMYFYYKIDPDYTIYYRYDDLEENIDYKIEDINDEEIGEMFYYLFSFSNVSYHKDFTNNMKVILYYKNVPLYCSNLACIDEGRTTVVPPKMWTNAYYIKDDFTYLMFEFIYKYSCVGYSDEAREMILRVVPVYENDEERDEFEKYIKNKGFSLHRLFGNLKEFGNLKDEALTRFNNTNIVLYKDYENLCSIQQITNELMEKKELVMNFASSENKCFDEITRYLRSGKMRVDWLNEWRNINNIIKE